MDSVKLNQTTKEIEIQGSESFIESNFHIIEDMLIPVLWVEAVEPQATAEATKTPEIIETPEIVMVAKPVIVETVQESKAKRPPVRKYFNTLGKLIRSEDTSINRNAVANVIEEKPAEISVASLMKKFGLSESKMGGIIRDAEKQGKVRRVQNGSFVWAEE